MPTAEPVYVWTGGDDGLTQRVAGEVRAALFADGRFVEDRDGKAVFRLGIPTHVAWRETAKGQQITVPYEMVVRGKASGRFTVTCYEADLTVCGRRIAKSAARSFSITR